MKKILIHLFIAILWITPTIVLAQSIGLKNPIKVNTISDLILIVTRVVRFIAIPFIVVMIMWAGFQYLWASYNGGDGGKISAANKQLKWTIIGAFILLSSELIAIVMRNTVNSLTR